MRVIVIGGGIMGCATALSLSQKGATVVLLERSVPGAEASSAAAGILGAQAEAHIEGEFFRTLLRARDEYGTWAEQLKLATKIDVGYIRSGVLKVAHRENESLGLSEIVKWQTHSGARAEMVTADRAREIEPSLAHDILSAAYFPDDAQVNPALLVRALVVAISESARVAVESGTSVSGLIIEHERCVGVKTDGGEWRGDAIVLAAGSWSSLVPDLPKTLPNVRPVRGQIVLLDERPPSLRTIVFGAGGYIVPRGDGHVICGSTMELVGFRREVTADGVHGVLHSALALSPNLARAQVAGMWSNFRPESASGAPLVGASSLPGLFLATGHHRNGILLAKQAADQVTSAILS